MPGRIVGALNQGIASLGEKIGNNTTTTSLLSHCSLNIYYNQILRVIHISALLFLLEIYIYDVFSVQEKPYSIVE